MRRVLLTAEVVVATGLALAVPASAAVGDLEFEDCITASEAAGPDPPGNDACQASADLTPSPTGENTGLSLPESVAVSPDGRSLYAVSGNDDAIARFDRGDWRARLRLLLHRRERERAHQL